MNNTTITKRDVLMMIRAVLASPSQVFNTPEEVVQQMWDNWRELDKTIGYEDQTPYETKDATDIGVGTKEQNV